MGLISKKKAELLNVKHLLFSFLCLSILRPHIESAPTRPNKYYHTVGVDTFRFRFPSEKSQFNYAEKDEELVSNGNEGVIKLPLHHNIHPTMINSSNSTKWMRKVVLHSLQRNKYRANCIIAASSTYNNRLCATASVPLVSGNPYGANFIVSVALGTPPKQKIMMNFDTGNAVSWLQCNYRGGSSSYQRLTCNSNSCNRQVDGMTCNRRLNQCIYQIQYNDGEEIMKARMSEDTLWLGSRPFPKFTFGCEFDGLESDPSIGLLSLGRNSLSLPSQTSSEYRRKFSYCLPDFLNPQQRGSLSLGLGSIPSTSKFTTLLSNPRALSWYFVGMTGISVGGRRLKISPDIFQFHSHGGGTIIDSGVLVSRIVKPAYAALRAAFVKKMRLVPVKPQPQNPLDTCFSYSGDVKNLKIPGIKLHFQDGVHLRIHKQGILTPVSENVICLAFQAADDSNLSIIGTLQQQRYIISFDQDANRIGFASVSTC